MRASRIAAPLFCLVALACATTTPPPPVVQAGPAPDWKLASVSMSAGDQFQGTVNGGQLSLLIPGR